MARGPIPDKPSDRPKVPEVVGMARRYYARPGNEMGGALHAVLDDGNLEDCCCTSARARAFAAGDFDGWKLANALLAMTRTQRRKVYRQLHARGVAPRAHRVFVTQSGAMPVGPWSTRHRFTVHLPPAS